MPRITRSSARPARSLKLRRAKPSRRLNSPPGLAHPPDLLTMTRLRTAFAALQPRLADQEQADRMAQLCQDIEQAVVESICHLAHGQLGLQSFIDLLASLGDDVRLPASRIQELLAPLDKRMGASLTLLSRVL